jgi:cytoskeletal protein CcmA (bactofilin family)
MSSWKSYGGIDKFDKTNHITVNSIVTNYFVIKKSIVGDIDISGNLSVGKYLYVDKDASFNGDISVSGSIDATTIISDGDITCSGNGYFKNNVNVSSVLYFGNAANQIYLYGDASGIGINHKSPQASLDISGNMVSSIHVFSSQSTTRNVLSQNKDKKGIVLWTDASYSTIDFFNDSTISSSESGFDGRVQYQNGGNLLIDANSVVKILPKLVVSDLSSDTGIKNSTVSIHNDISDNIYLYDIYNNDKSCLQNGISMVGMDNSAIMFMNMITPDNTGFSMGGGTYPYDNSRNMGTIGMIDVSNVVFIPSQTVVSGNSVVKYKTTTGINTYKPKTESYVLDVNGPLHVANGESSVIEKPLWEVADMKFHGNTGIAIGYPSTFTDTSFVLQCYYTTDKGLGWNSSNIVTAIIDNGIQIMRAVYIHDASYAFIYGDKMIGYYTYNGGIDWSSNSISGKTDDAQSLYIYTNSSNSRFFIGVIDEDPDTKEKQNKIYYYDASIGYVHSGSNYFTDTGASFSITSLQKMDVSGSYIHGANGNIYVAGNGIVKYDATSLEEINRHNDDMSYNNVYAHSNTFVVAVGDSIISYTHDGGAEWTDISQDTGDLTIENINLTSVHAYDSSNAIAVGDNGVIVFTNDGYIWRSASYNMLNSAGTGNLLDGSLNHITLFDKNEFILSNVKSSYYYDSSMSYNVGYTNLVYNFLPDLLNHSENNVMDVCGNMTIYGNIYMDSDASGANAIQSTRNTVYFMNENVENLYVGADASNIHIGKSDVGKTVVRHAMDISGNVDIQGNVVINGYITSLGTSSTVTSVYSMIIDWDKRTDTTVSYALDVSGTEANAKIDGSLNVVGDVYITSSTSVEGDSSGALYVTGGTKLNGQVVVANTTSASSDSSGALYVAGGGYFHGNLVAGSSDTSVGLHVFGGSEFSGNVVMSSTQNATANSTNAALYVKGGTRISGNVVVDNNVYISGSSNYPLYVAGGTSRFEKNLQIGKNLDVSGNVSFQGSVNTSGNTWTTSDYRIKDAVVSLADLSYGVDHLRPVYYYNTVAQHPQIGFIAHELQDDFAFLVNGEKDGETYQSVNYNGLIGLLVYEIQELKKQVALLKR